MEGGGGGTRWLPGLSQRLRECAWALQGWGEGAGSMLPLLSLLEHVPPEGAGPWASSPAQAGGEQCWIMGVWKLARRRDPGMPTSQTLRSPLSIGRDQSNRRGEGVCHPHSQPRRNPGIWSTARCG